VFKGSKEPFGLSRSHARWTRIGGGWTPSLPRNWSAINVKVLDELCGGLRHVSDLVRNPRFDPADIDKKKASSSKA